MFSCFLLLVLTLNLLVENQYLFGKELYYL